MTPDTEISTKARILDALAGVVVEGGLSDFSVQVVADRSGVSHRTVYRHFPTRESMLDGLVEQMSEAMAAHGGVDQVDDVDDLASAVAVNFALFSQQEAVVKAAVRLSVGTATENKDRRHRTESLRAAVERMGLPEGDTHLVAAMLRHLSSSRTWLLLSDSGLDAQDTATAASWAISTLVTAIRDGNGPSNFTNTASQPRSAKK